MIGKKIADTLLDEPLVISIDVDSEPIKPKNKLEKILQKIKLKRKETKPRIVEFKLTSCKLRTMVRISRLFLNLDSSPMPDVKDVLEYAYKSIDTNAYLLAEILASAIHNRKDEVPQSLIDLLYDNIKPRELRYFMDVVVDKLNVSDFISSIALVRNLNVIEASPEVMEELIAPSGQL